jgi:hypothetical protein
VSQLLAPAQARAAGPFKTGGEGGRVEGEGRTAEAEALLLRYRFGAGAMSTTVCAQTRTLAAKHGNVVLRKTVSSPAAAAAAVRAADLYISTGGGELQSAAQDRARVHSPVRGSERTWRKGERTGEGERAARSKAAPAINIDTHRCSVGDSVDGPSTTSR